MFQIKVVEKIKTSFVLGNLFSKIMQLMGKSGKIS